MDCQRCRNNTYIYDTVYDQNSRSVCFHYLSAWPEVRYDTLAPVPVEALRNCKTQKTKHRSSRPEVCASAQMHVCARAYTQSADGAASEIRKKEPNSYGLFGEGFVSAPKKVLIGLFDSCFKLRLVSSQRIV